MRFFEEYRCGCVSKLASKKDLPRYCDRHGHDWVNLYRDDGMRIAISSDATLINQEPAP